MTFIIIFCLLTRVFCEITSMEHSVYMSRKSRPNALPTESGYMYSRVNDEPGITSTFGHDSASNTPYTKNYNTASSEEHFDPPSFQYVDPEIRIPSTKTTTVVKEPPLTDFVVDAAIAKAEAKYNSKFLPSKIKSDAMYERLRSIMHYHPPDNNLEVPVGYDLNDYHLDEDDVRTSSRGLYDSWPYFYHSPYEYEHMKVEAEIEKAKDKRYVADTMPVIPVHEKIDEIPDSYEYNMLQTHYTSTTDNPIVGNAPFFSFILNDYFNKNSDDDPLSFKGLEWGKEFDYQPKNSNVEDYRKKKRQHIESNFYDTTTLPFQHTRKHISNNVLDNNKYGQSIKDKAYESKYEIDKVQQGNDRKENHKSAHDHDGKLHRSFKDFVDSFVNKFGGEDHKKDSKYLFKVNQDKGEKKKGFRRVYHKDEYQEDNEFFDNNNNSAKAEESGSSKGHFGGSEAFLQSHAVAALGEEGSSFNKNDEQENNELVNNHIGHDFIKGTGNQYNKYIDVAKQAASSNNADYTDHYRI